MSIVSESIITGLTEAVEDSHSVNKQLKRNTVTITPVKENIDHIDQVIYDAKNEVAEGAEPIDARIAKHVLEDMDRAISNYKNGEVSSAIDLSDI